MFLKSALIITFTTIIYSNYSIADDSLKLENNQTSTKPQKTPISDSRNNSNSNNGFYIEVKAGQNKPSKLTDHFRDFHKPKKTPLYEIKGGYEYGKFAIDLSYSQSGKSKVGYQDTDTLEETTYNYDHQFSINTKTLFVNGYYNFFKYERFKPYIGAGIGISRNKLSSIVVKNDSGNPGGEMRISDIRQGKTTSSFAWQIMGGALFEVSKNVDLSVEYKFAKLGSVKTGGGDRITYTYSGIRSVESNDIVEKIKN